jgi:DNA mismatch endonuclease (patch repair protein)
MAPAPYPIARDANVSMRMSRNRGRDTRDELRVRSRLHARGLRYRVDHRVDAGEVSVRPDIVFTRWHLAVFIDGCFWHACPIHGNVPEWNRDYWGPKLERTAARDMRVTEALRANGWVVIRAWEHEDPDAVADGIARELELLGHTVIAQPG